jgi:murein L,D-transpeptidase YafK
MPSERWWTTLLYGMPLVVVALVAALASQYTRQSHPPPDEGAEANMAPVPDRNYLEPAEFTCPTTLPDPIADDSRSDDTLIVIWKSEYKVGFYDHRQLSTVERTQSPACFDVALGFAPEGAKRTQGDGKTPEGWYWVSWKIPKGQTSYYKALYVNYPNAEDAAIALREGRVDQATHDRIASAASKHSTVTDSPLGALIEIHGSGSRPRNWTLGCVALDNENMDWLYEASVSGRTAIRILP